MDVEPLYCAEQIHVPEELPDILKQWTKAVIRENPSNIHEFSKQYFEKQLEAAKGEFLVMTKVLYKYLTAAGD